MGALIDGRANLLASACIHTSSSVRNVSNLGNLYETSSLKQMISPRAKEKNNKG